jgi:uncharacterized protein DUF433
MSALPEPLITISSEHLSGAPVFTGTRVPVRALFDHIEGGDPLDSNNGSTTVRSPLSSSAHHPTAFQTYAARPAFQALDEVKPARCRRSRG